ncbi:unnamed protein product [Protopolystoma xenopodis]|uniref:Uncharacterized protein n=1 Tax=Protopolystoma xenopodis TaxID=117903 RepID=A0A448WE92_9PLAT|nr:unnamed protein product [Protopolystoma xenopodis]
MGFKVGKRKPHPRRVGPEQRSAGCGCASLFLEDEYVESNCTPVVCQKKRLEAGPTPATLGSSPSSEVHFLLDNAARQECSKGSIH